MEALCDICNQAPEYTTYGLGTKRCERCSIAFNTQVQLERQRKHEHERMIQAQHVCGTEDQYDSICKECCEHGDMEEGYCLICGTDRTEELSAMAYDRYKDFIKYGEW